MSTVISGRGGKSGGRAVKAVGLTPGGLRCVPATGLRSSQGGLITAQKSTEGVVGGGAPPKPSVRKFLGFSFTGGTEPRCRIASQAIARFKAKVRELTRRTCGKCLVQIVKELSVYRIGWRGYFGFCQTPPVLRELDRWLRRRLRAIAWKQWKRGPARFAELRRRGVGRDLAAQTAGSPHDPWRLANSPALTKALPNSFFGSLGLASVAAQRRA
jgi:RNA-directed DNA polymerase